MKRKIILLFGMVFAMTTLPSAETKQVSTNDVQKITGSKNFASSIRAVDGKTFYELKNKDGKIAGYIFDTGDFVNDVNGFSGPIRMLVYVSADGVLRNFQVIASSDTPQYLNKAIQKKDRYIDKNIFQPGIADADAVTGATYSSKGIAKTLEKAGAAFAKLIGIPSKQTPVADLPSTSDADANAVNNPPPGGSRGIDAKQYSVLIKQKRLSDKPAMYAETVK
jgi:Na+-translocating ferredoxin:NAD+ oxidoreductase RnfG subunit